MAPRDFKFITCYQYDPSNWAYKPDPVSVTVPDMAFDLQELLKRFSVGSLPPDIIRATMYTDNPDFDDFISTEFPDYDLVDAFDEINKLRELHKVRMARREAANAELSSEQANGIANAPQTDSNAPNLAQSSSDV